MKVNILGTEYSILKKTHEEEPCLKENHWGGFCSALEKQIIILDLDKTESWRKENQVARAVAMKETLRHEIVHGFFNESGLQDSSCQYGEGWAKNEEMVDWIALQFPKMLKAFQEADCL